MNIIGDLAQQVVETVMPLVQHNVNIMDSNGMIIGSGQSYRLNTFHQGAKKAIETKQVIEIAPDEVEQYPGCLPGLNLPIVIREEVIGVVGISGHPDTVRPTATLVKAITEMILERELLREQFLSRSHLKEQLAALLLSGNAPSNYENLARLSQLLEYDLTLPRLAVVIDIQSFLEPDKKSAEIQHLISAHTRERILEIIEQSRLINAEDFVVFLDKRLLILKHMQEYNESSLLKWGELLAGLIKSSFHEIPLCIGFGSIVDSYIDISQSYREARAALLKCSADKWMASIYEIDIMISYLIATIHTAEPCQAFQLQKQRLELELGSKYDMKNTISCLINNNLNIANTAKCLYIHRNTLLFRLNKLKEITGLDPCHSVNHAFLCKMLFGC